MTIEQARKLAKKKLSAKRFRHTKNVAAAAVVLARRWEADPEKAELAAWLHDIVKEKSRAELLQILEQDDIIAGSIRQRPQAVWHGPAAAIYARHQLGVQDEEVLSAMACHTTGKVDMSLLDKVVFLADVISAERRFDGVDTIRALAESDLNAAVIAALEENLDFLDQGHKPLDEESVQALLALRAKQGGPVAAGQGGR